MATTKITLNELRSIVKQIIKEENLKGKINLNEIKGELHLSDAMREEFYEIFSKRLEEQIKNVFGENSKFYYGKYEEIYSRSIGDRIDKLIENIYEISIKQGVKEFDDWGNRHVPNRDLFIKQSDKYIEYIIEKLKNYKQNKFNYVIIKGKSTLADDDKFTNLRDDYSDYIIGYEDNEKGEVTTLELSKIIDYSTNPNVFIFDNKQQFNKYLPYIKLLSGGIKDNEKLNKWVKLNNFSEKDFNIVNYKEGLKNHFNNY